MRCRLLLALPLLLGCPGSEAPSRTDPAPPAPSPAAQGEEPVSLEGLPPAPAAAQPENHATPEGKQELAKWQALGDRVGTWAPTLARRLKDASTRQALEPALQAETEALRRLALLARNLPLRTPGGLAPMPLNAALRKRLAKVGGVLDSGTFALDEPRSVLLVALMDPGFLSGLPLIKDGQGWTSVRDGLATGRCDPGLARGLREAVEAAHDGDWAGAAPGYTAALTQLSAENSRVQGPGAQKAWEQVEAGLKGDPEALKEPLTQWLIEFLGKKGK